MPAVPLFNSSVDLQKNSSLSFSVPAESFQEIDSADCMIELFSDTLSLLQRGEAQA